MGPSFFSNFSLKKQARLKPGCKDIELFLKFKLLSGFEFNRPGYSAAICVFDSKTKISDSN
ncbi:MAG: hypothetical protein EBR30_18710 [Cytophagia bacterium]|nr:hypothetical protein [Cytophagia bacterium]NBW37016.1 hypothetical protein [Cytophagia bacterium]